MFRSAAVAAVLLASVAVAVAAPVPKDLKKKDVKIDGTWEVVEWHSHGTKVNGTLAMKWVIDGQTLSIERTNPKLGGAIARPAGVSYTLVKPDGGAANALDYTINYTNGLNPSRAMPGVFELDGDSLKFCYTSAANGERPAKCEPAQGNIMYVFKRVDAK